MWSLFAPWEQRCAKRTKLYLHISLGCFSADLIHVSSCKSGWKMFNTFDKSKFWRSIYSVMPKFSSAVVRSFPLLTAKEKLVSDLILQFCSLSDKIFFEGCRFPMKMKLDTHSKGKVHTCVSLATQWSKQLFGHQITLFLPSYGNFWMPRIRHSASFFCCCQETHS